MRNKPTPAARPAATALRPAHVGAAIGRLLAHSLAVVALAGLSACSDDAGKGDDKGAADATIVDGGLDGVTSTDDAAADAAPTGCPPALAGCVDDDRVVCNAAGTQFELIPCGVGMRCVDGVCKACASDADCSDGRVCTGGACLIAPLSIVTKSLPAALLSTPYGLPLVSHGGVAPWTWSLSQGVLPDGILLSPDGKIAGVATKVGTQSFAVAVKDGAGNSAEAILVLEVKGGGLVITTTSPLPKATEGKAYNVQIEATGGEKPYFFGLVAGKLPAGIGLSADGVVAGTPSEDGTFSFDLKVLDNAQTPATTTRTFELPVSLAPLNIVGAQQIDLFIIKIIVLPLIIVVNNIPVPYSNNLEATGGKKPYSWVEVPLPGAVKSFIPNAGLPKGLSLDKNGKISGSVTDPKLAVKVAVPLTQISLEGFFFAAEVSDSQSPAKTKTAMFIIPTAPIGN